MEVGAATALMYHTMMQRLGQKRRVWGTNSPGPQVWVTAMYICHKGRFLIQSPQRGLLPVNFPPPLASLAVTRAEKTFP